jgi:hypothetical protein
MGYRELLPYNAQCDHLFVVSDEKLDADGRIETLDVECKECGNKAWEEDLDAGHDADRNLC